MAGNNPGPGALSHKFSSLSITKPAPMTKSPSGTSMYVGIDMASSLSAVSIMPAGRIPLSIRDLYSLKDWPHGFNQVAVPSVLSYLRNSNGILELKWGYSATHPQHGSIQVKGFKSTLHRGQENAQDNSELNELASALGKTSSHKFIIDFLTELKKHIDAFLMTKYQGNFAEGEVMYIICVPSCYTAREIRFFKNCCTAGGFQHTSLILASEPEAMLVAGIERGYIKSSSFKIHLIVDGGAFTVDAAAFLIWRQKEMKPTLQIHELSVSNGVPCGGNFLTRCFRNLLNAKMETCQYPPVPLERIYGIILNYFEFEFKLSFDGTQDFVATVDSMIGLSIIDLEFGIEFHGVFISKEEIAEKVFGPAINTIIKLIDQQLGSLPDHKAQDIIIDLCGGLFSNQYICKTVKSGLPKNLGFNNIPYQKNLASDGLVLIGAADHPVEVISQITIGIETELPHADGDLSYNHSGEVPQPMVKAVEWFMAYGQTVTKDTHLIVKLYYSLREDNFTAISEEGFRQKFYISKSKFPEKRFTYVSSIDDEIQKDEVEVEEFGWNLEEKDIVLLQEAFRAGPQKSRRPLKLEVDLNVKVDLTTFPRPEINFSLDIALCPEANADELMCGGRFELPVMSPTMYDLHLKGTMGNRRPSHVLAAEPGHNVGDLIDVPTTNFSELQELQDSQTSESTGEAVNPPAPSQNFDPEIDNDSLFGSGSEGRDEEMGMEGLTLEDAGDNGGNNDDDIDMEM